MLIQDYLLNDIEEITPSMPINKLQHFFKSFPHNYLPIVQDKMYLGAMHEEDVECLDPSKTVADYRAELNPFFVEDSAHWLDVLDVFARQKTSILPVISLEQKQYLGYYELQDFIGLLNQTPFLSEPGSILVVEKELRDFTFSELTQIIESEGAKVLGCLISKMANHKVEATIKTNLANVNTLLQHLRRFGYLIISNHQDDVHIQSLRERSQYLSKYLNL